MKSVYFKNGKINQKQLKSNLSRIYGGCKIDNFAISVKRENSYVFIGYAFARELPEICNWLGITHLID
jgi:hypothetical protein